MSVAIWNISRESIKHRSLPLQPAVYYRGLVQDEWRGVVVKGESKTTWTKLDKG